MLGMQEFVCSAAQGLFQEFFIGFLHLRILMGEPKLSFAVQSIQSFSTLSGGFTAVMDRLSAAPDAAAGARHNFHKIIRHFSCLNILHQLPCIGQPTDSAGM